MVYRAALLGLVAVVLGGSLALLCGNCWADAYFNEGVQLYNQRKFKNAAQCFEQSVKDPDADGSTYYYAALTYSQLGDWAHAREAYKQVCVRFPNSPAAQLAMSALSRLDPGFVKKSAGTGGSISSVQSSGASGGDVASGPEEAKVYFTRDEHDKMILDAYVNNRFTKMMFDTGAEGCHFAKNQLEAIGIAPPQGKPTGMSYGVGGVVGTWQMPLSIKIGPIQKKLMASVQEADYGAQPLLGENFFNGFEYDIDNGGHFIHFKKKHAGASGKDLYSIPFRRGGGAGNEMVVDLEVKGHRCSVFFDTGAQATTISKSNLTQLGMDIAPDAEKVYMAGIGGLEPGYRMTLDELRLGPVVKRNFPVTVLEHGMGLLGQDFFQDWRYTIDNANRLIKLFH